MTQVRLCCALILLIAVSAPAVSRETTDSAAQQGDRGKLLYRIHCQNCHGERGAGDGPMAKLLTIQPTDLTSIARRNEGDFPTDRMRLVIDGRSEVRGHGVREMPVWGLSLQQPDRDSDQEKEVRARIDDLVAHLKTIQNVEE
jgi:mono/diheme cytochrome c family protein